MQPAAPISTPSPMSFVAVENNERLPSCSPTTDTQEAASETRQCDARSAVLLGGKSPPTPEAPVAQRKLLRRRVRRHPGRITDVLQDTACMPVAGVNAAPIFPLGSTAELRIPRRRHASMTPIRSSLHKACAALRHPGSYGGIASHHVR